MSHDFVAVHCSECDLYFGMPREFYNVMKTGAGRLTWYCPNGHPRVFAKGESEADKLRRERDQLKQEQAWYEDRLKAERASRETVERKLSASKGQITKIKKRAAAGVCPCCNRQFVDLARHMAGKHPGFVAEPTADEHVH